MAKRWLVLSMLAACSRAPVLAPTTQDGTAAIASSGRAAPRSESAELERESATESSDMAPTTATAADADVGATAQPRLLLATSVEGEAIEMREAIAMPMDDGRALVLLTTVERGCTILSRADEASVVIGMVVRWKAAATTDVARVEKPWRPYAIVRGARVLAEGPPERRDVPWKAKGTVRVTALPSAAGDPARVRFDLGGDACSVVGEIDVRVCPSA
jgi:hypothetical protein